MANECRKSVPYSCTTRVSTMTEFYNLSNEVNNSIHLNNGYEIEEGDVQDEARIAVIVDDVTTQIPVPRNLHEFTFRLHLSKLLKKDKKATFSVRIATFFLHL